MLKKIPPDPLIGSCRVVRKFTWKKLATYDRYYVWFRYFYNVEQYMSPSFNERAYTGNTKPYYSLIASYAIKDDAEALANMLTLQCVKQDNV